jgi:hypothetical protein
MTRQSSQKVRPAEVEVAEIEQCLQKANDLAQSGQLAAAGEQRELAARAALREGDGAKDPLMAASALLLHCHALLEESKWPSGGQPALDVQIQEALRLASKAKTRNRELEGQLQLTLSRALFAKPSGRDIADLDTAIDARHKAVQLFVDGAVAQLPWSVEVLQRATQELSKGEELQLGLVELRKKLKAKVGCFGAAAPALENLFDAWSSPSGGQAADGSVLCSISIQHFLSETLKVAKRLATEDAMSVAAAACRAPCEGGVKGLTRADQALLALVATGGAESWESKAAEMAAKGFSGMYIEATSLATEWARLAPIVKKATDADAEMTCGHSCSTCPTRSECKVHEALAQDF